MDERLQKQLDFALEIDKEKNIFRQTHLSGHGRNENDAEHAWHMAIMAYLLREYANERVNIERVMIMCLMPKGSKHRKPGRKPQKNGSFLFFLMIRKKSFPHCLMNLRQMKRQNQDLHMRWTICSL